MKTAKLMALSALSAATLIGGCATLEEGAAKVVAETHHATLTGAEVVGGGDTDGYATADLTISDELDQVCYDVKDIRNVGPITAIMVHRGATGTNGPVVYTLKPANEGGYKGCDNIGEWTEGDFEKNPTGYYFLIHTQDYPNGAIRGQIRND